MTRNAPSKQRLRTKCSSHGHSNDTARANAVSADWRAAVRPLQGWSGLSSVHELVDTTTRVVLKLSDSFTFPCPVSSSLVAQSCSSLMAIVGHLSRHPEVLGLPDDLLLPLYRLLVGCLLRQKLTLTDEQLCAAVEDLVAAIRKTQGWARTDGMRVLSFVLYANGQRCVSKYSLLLELLLPNMPTSADELCQLSADSKEESSAVIEQQRMAIGCLGNLCTRAGQCIKDILPSVFRAVLTAVREVRKAAQREPRLSKVLATALRSSAAVLEEAHQVRPELIRKENHAITTVLSRVIMWQSPTTNRPKVAAATSSGATLVRPAPASAPAANAKNILSGADADLLRRQAHKLSPFFSPGMYSSGSPKAAHSGKGPAQRTRAPRKRIGQTPAATAHPAVLHSTQTGTHQVLDVGALDMTTRSVSTAVDFALLDPSNTHNAPISTGSNSASVKGLRSTLAPEQQQPAPSAGSDSDSMAWTDTEALGKRSAAAIAARASNIAAKVRTHALHAIATMAPYWKDNVRRSVHACVA